MAEQDTTQLERARAVVEAREQRLAGELRELTAQCQGAERMLAQLDAYLDEYNGADGARGARSAGDLMNARQFARRLGSAVAEQRGQARLLGERVTHKALQWRKARADLAAVDRLIEARRRAQRQAAERREQRETDAQAARSRSLLDAPRTAQAPCEPNTNPRTESSR